MAQRPNSVIQAGRAKSAAPLDLGLPAEREPVQPLVVVEIAKCRLHRRKAFTVSHLALSSLFTLFDTDKLS